MQSFCISMEMWRCPPPHPHCAPLQRLACLDKSLEEPKESRLQLTRKRPIFSPKEIHLQCEGDPSSAWRRPIFSLSSVQLPPPALTGGHRGPSILDLYLGISFRLDVIINQIPDPQTTAGSSWLWGALALLGAPHLVWSQDQRLVSALKQTKVSTL